MWKPVLLMFVAMSFIPAGDTAGKLLTNEHGTSAIFVAWTRFWIGALLVLPFAPSGSFAALRDPRVIFRALLLTGGICSILTALRTAPLADAFAAFFIGPSVSYLLAVVFLKERFSLLRAGLVALGFVGMLIIVRPGGDAAPGLGWAVLAGTFYGAFLTASRWLSDAHRPRVLLFSQLFVSAIATTPAALFALPATISPVIGGLATLSALFSMLGNFLLLFAYRMAPATTLAPLIYFQLVAATILGWTIFGSLPDALTWTGLSIVMASGIASALLAPKPTGAPSPARADRA